MTSRHSVGWLSRNLRLKINRAQKLTAREDREHATISTSFDDPSKLSPSIIPLSSVPNIDQYENSESMGFKVVTPDYPRTEDLIELDIWFIHGLTGHREKTWTHSNGTFWPNLLANDFPKARVITYGYDANVARFNKRFHNSSSEGLHSYGQSLAFTIRNSRQDDASRRRPIYFIAHSLGGLVVEQALMICIGPDQTLHEIASATAGVLFMGTPHQGSHLAKWGSALGKVIPDNIRTVNQKALEVLKKDSAVCALLENAFQEHAKNGQFKHVKLFSFYETIAMNGLGSMIVPEVSAVLKGDFKCPIHGTHTSMTRFEGPSDDGYRKVKGQLQAWLLAVDKPPKELSHKPDSLKKKGPSNITLHGPSVKGNISGGIFNANQTAAGGNVYYYYSSDET